MVQGLLNLMKLCHRPIFILKNGMIFVVLIRKIKKNFVILHLPIISTGPFSNFTPDDPQRLQMKLY